MSKPDTYFKVAPMPETISGVSVGDIPIKYYDKKPLLPFSISIHATLADFKRPLYYCNNL